MNIIRSVIMAFSMFSKIPMPRIEWKKENMSFSLAALWIVGAVIGGILIGWHFLCEAAGLAVMIRSAGITVIPILVTGGIHLDGLCDTADALASHASPEKKKEILKDHHSGAFAVICFGAYLISYFALSTELITSADMFILALIHILSRAFAALFSLTAPSASHEGLLSVFKEGSRKTLSVVISAAVIFLISAALIYSGGFSGCAVFASGGISSLLTYLIAKKEFGGMSGDLSGFMLQIAEIVMIFAYITVREVMT